MGDGASDPRPGHQRRRIRRRPLLIGSLVALLALHFAHDEAAHTVASGRRDAHEVLGETALRAFHKELPHWLHSTAGQLIRPLQERVPDPGKPGRLAALRRDFQRLEHSFVLVEAAAARSPYRHWFNSLSEVCYILGYEEWEAPSAAAPHLLENEAEEGVGRMCPELWVDKAWPPSVQPLGQRGRAQPVWSEAGGAGLRERGVLVMQERLLSEFSEAEVKALLGYELARVAWDWLPTGVAKQWSGHLAKLTMSSRLLQHVNAIATPAPSGPLAGLFSQGGPATMGTAVGGVDWLLKGPAKPVTEWVALDMVMSRIIPGLFRPFLYGGLLARGGPSAILEPMQQHLQGVGSLLGVRRPRRRRSLFFGLFSPWVALLAEAGLYRGMSAGVAAYERAVVITSDRAAALAAGDATAAASALLRANGLLHNVAKGADIEDTLQSFSYSAETREWDLRRESFVRDLPEPTPEVRVRELLRWSRTEAAHRLMALADLRRGMHAPAKVSLWSRLFGGSPPSLDDRPSTSMLQVWGTRFTILTVLALPFVAPIDLVRWATLSTLSVAALGVTAPFLHGAGLPLPASIAAAILLGLYASVAWIVWWNHLLGGARRWAELSSRLTSQLADQADVTAGIAYLTKDWAEMARRSLAALDQELCGSWRASLHELASKLADLRQDYEANSPMRHAPVSPQAGDRRLMLDDLSRQVVPRLSHSHSLPGLQQDPTPHTWLRVDRAIQSALRVEVERMTRALAVEDPVKLQTMMAWWNTDRCGPPWWNHSFQQEPGVDESLSALLLSDRLHQRYQYPSFCADEESNGDRNPAAAREQEFRRLEEALASTFKCMEELRGRLAPMEGSAGSLRCCRWSDLRRTFQQVRGVLQRGMQGDPSDSPLDRAQERGILGCLALAVLLGGLAAPGAALLRCWVWAVAASGFGAANLVLLLNFSRLSLPHVHRRLERQLAALSARRDSILSEIRTLQASSARAGKQHVRACIFLQSVNVLRNINYFVLCLKTEAQRIALSGGQHSPNLQDQALQRFRRCAPGLLLALLPRCGSPREAHLSESDCGDVALLLGAHQQALPGVAGAAPPPGMRQRIDDSQKRLWILFRMVHLSSALPLDAQGRLGALMSSYLRPIVMEGRVPMRQMPSLALQSQRSVEEGEGALLRASNGRKPMLESGVQDGVDENDHNQNLGWEYQRRLNRSSSSPYSGNDNLLKGVQEGFVNELAVSNKVSHMSSAPVGNSLQEGLVNDLAVSDKVSRCDVLPLSPNSNVEDALRVLAATRRDVTKVLALLAPEALIGGVQSDGLYGSSRSSQAAELLSDIFSSVVLVLQPGAVASIGGTPHNPDAAARSFSLVASGGAGKAAKCVAAATGYGYGERVYRLDGLRTNLVVRAVVLRTCAHGHVEEEGDSNAPWSGSIGTLRNTTTSWWGVRAPERGRKAAGDKSPPMPPPSTARPGPFGGLGSLEAEGSAGIDEVEVPLSAVLEEAPELAASCALWRAAAAALPSRFGTAALQERGRALRRAKAAARSLRRAQPAI